MIATILPSSSSFHAVPYNETKVSEGKAELIVMRNFGSLEVFGHDNPKQIQDYLADYSSRNSRIKKPQFHLAISCKGDDWTVDELREFAEEYLREMGYDDPEQPILMYAHHDTDNNHIHIITSRVAPDGKKIDDSKERIRSQKAIEKILKMNVEKKAEEDVRTALSFKYASIREFKSILEAMGYDVFESKKSPCSLYVKKGGKIRTKVSIDEIEAGFSKPQELEKSERLKWRAIFARTKDAVSNRESFAKKIRKQLGVQPVFFGPKDNPMGFHLVDFANKRVLWGEPVVSLKSLLDFRPISERIAEIEVTVDRLFNQFPYLTTIEVNRHLRPLSAAVKKGYYWFRDRKTKMDERIYSTLRRNDRIAWLNEFGFTSEEERLVVCGLVKFEQIDLIRIAPTPPESYKPEAVAALQAILGEPDEEQRRTQFKDAGYRLFMTDTGTYIVNMKEHVIIDTEKAGISQADIDALRPQREQTGYIRKPELPERQIRIPKARPTHVSSQNREWEVGRHERDKDDPDRQQGVGY